MKLVRILSLSMLLVLVLSLGFGLTQAQEGETLVIGWEQEPPLLSPRTDMAFGALLQDFYARDLWNWDVNRDIYPIMAAEIPSPDNGGVTTLENGNTQVTYKLRQGMKWSDGEEVTSADCAFAHELYMNPESMTFQRTSYPDVVESFEVVDDYTFVLTYNSPFPDYLTQSTATCLWPEHVLRPVLEAEGTLDNAPFWAGEGTVGYGPYVLSEWRVGESMTFTANPNWDGAAPGFETVILRFILDSSQMQNAFEVGDIDVAFNFSDDLVESYQSVEGAEVFSTAGVFGDALWINYGNNSGPVASALADSNVRTALIAAIDRATLAEQLVGPGVGVPASWYAPAFIPEDVTPIEYNVDQANELLDASGWVDTNGNGIRDKDGEELILRFFTTDRQIRMDYQVAIQQYWSEVGVGSQLFPVPAGILFADYLERGILDTGDFDVALFALSTGPLSPFADAPDWFGCNGIPTPEQPNGNNGWGSCSEEFDRLDLEVGRTVDPDARLELAQEAIRQFRDMNFWHGLYLRPTWYAVNSNNVDPATTQDVGTLSSNYFNKIELWQPAQ